MRKVWPLWLLSLGALAGCPLSALFYYDALLGSGTLPASGDSIGIPIFSSMLVTLLALPIVLFINLLATRNRVTEPFRLFAWRADRPILSWGATLLFGALACWFLYGAVEPLIRSLPWYENISSPEALACAAWCLTVRSYFLMPIAAAVRPAERGRAPLA
jgi:hypothetical protein